MTDVFGSVYAASYDVLYNDKDYQAECDLLERIFRRYSSRQIQSILDLCCGTGNHSLPLAERGYQVVGVDRSAPMLESARKKAGTNSKVLFELGDVRQFRFNTDFDAVLMMFATLGYQLSDADVNAALRTVKAHLAPEGLLVFDVWYGPAVVGQKPSNRMKTVPAARGEIVRTASGELDLDRKICNVNFHLVHRDGSRVISETREIHPMRYFFREELETFLKTAGLRLMRLGAFPDLEREPDESTWSVLGVAKPA